MMSLDEAVRAIQVHARQIEAVQTVAAAIDDVAKLDALRFEAEARAKDATDRATEAQSAALVAGKMLDEVNAAVVAASGRADALMDEARQAANGVTARARADADKIIADAKAAAASIANESAIAREALASLKAAGEKAQAAFEAMKSDQIAELESITAKIAAAREVIAKMMRG